MFKKMYVQKPQPLFEVGKIRLLIMLFAVALGVFSFCTGFFCLGSIPPACIALFIFLLARFWNIVVGEKDKTTEVLFKIMWGVVAVVCCVLIIVSAFMIHAFCNTLPEDVEDYTVVVLGCKVRGSTPSRMLTDRLLKAEEFLNQHPQAYCVVSGGKGEDENLSEAAAMKMWLTEHGIAAERIYTEDTSENTEQNLKNSAEVIKQNGLSETVVIVTDKFHQYRAQKQAKAAGLEQSYSAANSTRWWLAMPYWFREIIGILKFWILG